MADIGPFVEISRIQSEINRLFEAAHQGGLKRRAVLVPTA